MRVVKLSRTSIVLIPLVAAAAFVGLLLLADEAAATHSAPSNLDAPLVPRCTHTLSWPASNPPGPTQGVLVLNFTNDAQVFASAYYLGGNGTVEDPALIHVPGCLQALVHVTAVTKHVQFIDTAYWVPVNPATLPGAASYLPVECRTRAAVFCIHDVPAQGLVSVRDFYLNHDMPLLNVVRAHAALYESAWGELPRAGSIGAIHDDGFLRIEGVVWQGIDATTQIRTGGRVDVVASDLHTIASWCIADTAGYIPPLNLSPFNPVQTFGTAPHEDTSDVYEPLLGSLHPLPPPLNATALDDLAQNISMTGLPEWIGYGLDGLWTENLNARERVLDRYTYLPAFPGAPPQMSLVFFDVQTDGQLHLVASRVAGAFVAVRTHNAVVESVGSTIGCSAWGVVSQASTITSLRTTFRDVAFPYKLNASSDVWASIEAYLADPLQESDLNNLVEINDEDPVPGRDVPLEPVLGAVIQTVKTNVPLPPLQEPKPYSPPPRAFLSVCDVFDGTHPLSVLSNQTVTLFGTTFVDGIPVHAREAIERGTLVGLQNLVPLPDNVRLLGGAHASAMNPCAGPFNLDPVTVPPVPLSSSMSVATPPPFPLYYLLDGAGNVRTYPSTTLNVTGVVNVPLVSPDLLSVHLLVLAPHLDVRSLVTGSAGGWDVGFYNFMFDTTSGFIQSNFAGTSSFGPYVPGTTSGGYGFLAENPITHVPVTYYYQEDSLVDVCVPNCGPLSAVGSLLNAGFGMNTLTACLMGTIQDTTVNAWVTRAPTSCGQSGQGTDATSHVFNYGAINLEARLEDRSPRKIHLVIEHVPQQEELLIRAETSNDSDLLSVHFWTANAVGNLDLLVNLEDVQRAKHTINVLGTVADQMHIHYHAEACAEACECEGSVEPRIGRATIDVQSSALFVSDLVVQMEPIEGPKDVFLSKQETTTEETLRINFISEQETDLLASVDVESSRLPGPIHVDGTLRHAESNNTFRMDLVGTTKPARSFDLTTPSGYIRVLTLDAWMDGDNAHFTGNLVDNARGVFGDTASALLETVRDASEYPPGGVFISANLNLDGSTFTVGVTGVTGYKRYEVATQNRGHVTAEGLSHQPSSHFAVLDLHHAPSAPAVSWDFDAQLELFPNPAGTHKWSFEYLSQDRSGSFVQDRGAIRHYLVHYVDDDDDVQVDGRFLQDIRFRMGPPLKIDVLLPERPGFYQGSPATTNFWVDGQRIVHSEIRGITDTKQITITKNAEDIVIDLTSKQVQPFFLDLDVRPNSGKRLLLSDVAFHPDAEGVFQAHVEVLDRKPSLEEVTYRTQRGHVKGYELDYTDTGNATSYHFEGEYLLNAFYRKTQEVSSGGFFFKTGLGLEPPGDPVVYNGAPATMLLERNGDDLFQTAIYNITGPKQFNVTLYGDTTIIEGLSRQPEPYYADLEVWPAPGEHLVLPHLEFIHDQGVNKIQFTVIKSVLLDFVAQQGWIGNYTADYDGSLGDIHAEGNLFARFFFDDSRYTKNLTVELPLNEAAYVNSTGFVKGSFIPSSTSIDEFTVDATLANITGHKSLSVLFNRESVSGSLLSDQTTSFNLTGSFTLRKNSRLYEVDAGLEFLANPLGQHLLDFEMDWGNVVDVQVLAGAIGNWSVSLDENGASTAQLRGNMLRRVLWENNTETSQGGFVVEVGTPRQQDVYGAASYALFELWTRKMGSATVNITSIQGPVDYHFDYIAGRGGGGPSQGTSGGGTDASFIFTALLDYLSVPEAATADWRMSWNGAADEATMTNAGGFLRKFDIHIQAEDAFTLDADGEYLESFTADLKSKEFTMRSPERGSVFPASAPAVFNLTVVRPGVNPFKGEWDLQLVSRGVNSAAVNVNSLIGGGDSIKIDGLNMDYLGVLNGDYGNIPFAIEKTFAPRILKVKPAGSGLPKVECHNVIAYVLPPPFVALDGTPGGLFQPDHIEWDIPLVGAIEVDTVNHTHDVTGTSNASSCHSHT